MDSVLNEIIMIRKGLAPMLSLQKANPYIVTTEEANGTKTDYCFSIPIRTRTGKIVQPFWKKAGSCWIYKSVGGDVCIDGSKMQMKNEHANCLFVFPDRCESCEPIKIARNYSDILPTPNGVNIRTRLGQGREYHLTLEHFSDGLKVIKNDKYFSLITPQNVPFATVSGVFASDDKKQTRGAVDLFGRKIGNRKYDIRIKPKMPASTHMEIDVAFYQKSIFQDATVESLHPTQKNLYGSAANVGFSIPYGEQILYLKFMNELLGKQLIGREIRSATWHIPCCGTPGTELDLIKVEDAYEAELLTWESKKEYEKILATSVFQGEYINLNVTKLLQEASSGNTQDFYYMLRAHRSKSFASFSKANCNAAPQILEINYAP